MSREFFIKQLQGILHDFEVLESRSEYNDLSDRKADELMAIISRAKAAVARITGSNSEYYKDIEAALKRTNLHEGEKLRHVIGTTGALKSDLENDYLKSLSEIIQSEVFADYMEMADHLLTEGYKDPAAVLIGSTLEAHLKELCKINNITLESKNAKGDLIPKKADVLNSELAKASVYNGIHQKPVTAWLAIRNSAAHGKYNDYKVEEVKLMSQGLRQFMLAIK